jgi:TonB family protein
MSASIRAWVTKSMNRRATSLTVRVLAVLAIAASLGIGASGVALAQARPDGFEKLARALAAELEKAHAKRVAIFDLETVNNKQLPFGAFLADRISAELSKPGTGIESVMREQLTKVSTGAGLDPKERSKLRSAAAESLGAGAYVTGTYSAIGDGIGVTLVAVRVSGESIRKSKDSFSTAAGKIALDEDVKSHLGMPIESLRPADGVYKPGVGGVGVPECERCPQPQFSPTDVSRAMEAHIGMNAIISTAGTVLQVDLTKSAGAVFDEQAIANVRTWKFKPARDPDGNPVMVRQLVEITFKLY